METPKLSDLNNQWKEIDGSKSVYVAFGDQNVPKIMKENHFKAYSSANAKNYDLIETMKIPRPSCEISANLTSV